MKKLKSTILFVSLFTLLAVILCFNSSAAEWKKLGDIQSKYDEDTGVIVIKGDKAKIDNLHFGITPMDIEYALSSSDGDHITWDEDYNDGEISDFREFDLAFGAADKDAANAKTVIIEEGIKELDVLSLSHFKSAEVIILPESITEIAEGAFYKLENLKTLVLSPKTTKINDYAFYGCKNLKTINFPSTLNYVGRKAFFKCNFDYIKIPDTVKTVKEGNTDVKPANLKKVEVASVSDNHVTLKWKGVKDANGYRVFIRSNGKWKKVKDIFENEQFFMNVSANKKYTFAVRPFNAVDLNKWGPGEDEYNYTKLVFAPKYVKLTVETAPEEPEITVSSKSKGKVTVKWNNVAGETGYQVWYSTRTSSGFKKVGNYKANTTSATKSGLTSGKKYYFKVRAYKKTADGYVYSGWWRKGVKVK